MTQPLRLYGLKRCGTCVKAQSWLGQHGLAFEFIDYRDSPVPAETLRLWAQAVGGWEKLINRASTTWRNLDEAQKSASTDEAWLALLAQWPALVKRPVLVHPDGAVTTGFSDKKYTELLG